MFRNIGNDPFYRNMSGVTGPIDLIVRITVCKNAINEMGH
ncbi:hypothetical protein MCC01950_01120 [Bifidobacteriaceae bacterium MCC01950]|nr:hypothetical protein MCC01950_01120 [Bifidobacteriaceae bacterium MCC01950]